MNKKEHIIEVVPYDPNWPKLFETEAIEIGKVLSDNFVIFHHFGSTSVPGLAAKPTIDILFEVKNIELVDQCNNEMEKLGYEAWGEYGICGRRFFIKGEEKRTHHAHIFQVNNPEIARHLYFRDYLKSHPKDAEEYAKLKIELASRFSHDRQGYIQNKKNYVDALEKKAIAWFFLQK